MRKEYGKILRKLFDQQIKEDFPDFRPAKISNIYFTPGDRAFEKKSIDGASLWINLSINAKYESFNVEIGWSTFGRWPELSMRPSPIRPVGSPEFAEEEYITRLPFLWTNDDFWFEIEPFEPTQTVESIVEKMKPIEETKAREQVAPVVKECFEKVAKYAIPYFQRYSERNA